MNQKIHTISEGRQRNCQEYDAVRQTHSTSLDNSHQNEQHLMQAVVEQENMRLAFKRVIANKGAPGIDGMTVDDLKQWLIENWHRVKEELLNGRYKPQSVRRVEIPKPGGKGMRQLGIPTVVDRMVQQALHQVLNPLFDPYFSEHSYGFRSGRSAQMAVLAARQFVADGRRWKRPRFRVKKLMKRGLSRDRARQGAYNGHGPWFNSGASHMNLAFTKRFFNNMGLYSLLEEMLLRRAT